jgi:hypothetical protein
VASCAPGKRLPVPGFIECSTHATCRHGRRMTTGSKLGPPKPSEPLRQELRLRAQAVRSREDQRERATFSRTQRPSDDHQCAGGLEAVLSPADRQSQRTPPAPAATGPRPTRGAWPYAVASMTGCHSRARRRTHRYLPFALRGGKCRHGHRPDWSYDQMGGSVRIFAVVPPTFRGAVLSARPAAVSALSLREGLLAFRHKGFVAIKGRLHRIICVRQ